MTQKLKPDGLLSADLYTRVMAWPTPANKWLK